MKNAKNLFRAKMNQIPLWTQLLVLITLVTTLLTSFILARDYAKNKQEIMEQQIATSHRLLDLEMQNLEQYIKDLASFCLQPLYDTEFNTILKSRTPLDTVQASYAKDQIRTYYFSRTDLQSYELYLCHAGETYGRTHNSQHVTLLPASSLPLDEGCSQSSEGKNYNAIMPSDYADTFFAYYQSIIRIKDFAPEAVVKVEVDTSYADTLNAAHQSDQEFICIFNSLGELLYSGDHSLLDSDDAQAIRLINDSTDSESMRIDFQGASYLGVVFSGSRYGLKMASFLPFSCIHDKISSILRTSLLSGILMWIFSAIAIYVILRFTMKPLTQLSSQMQKVGSGNFSLVTDINGSLEITDLAANFNDMVSHIDHLIRQNYLSEISEKTSRLAALEAQLNPHFLYNTLQAIATEALVNDQPQIYEMVTSLASNLRYSIKGGDLIRLGAEMTYVKNYILLQKLRLEDRLTVNICVDEELHNMLIPKISIQTLVENSIIHGMGPDNDSISITIQAALKDDILEVTVADNGCGISPEQLQKMQLEFEQFLKPGTIGKIGLANLYSRLQLLYSQRAALKIESKPGQGTRITMKLPADKRSQKEGTQNV